MDTRWHVRRLFDSPHRLGFAAAAAVLASAAAVWAGLLVWPVPVRPGAMPAPTAHGPLFVFGFMPLFFAGFLFTVGPRWLGHAMDDARYAALARRVRTPVLVYAAAWLAWWPTWLVAAIGSAGAEDLTVAGTALAAAALPPAALLALAALGWSVVVARLTGLRWRGAAARGVPGREAAPDSPHFRIAVHAAAVGAALLWASAGAAALQAWGLLHALTLAALWSFCGGVFASASHRMLPLDAMADRPALEARHPLWLLAVLGAALGGQAADVLAAALWWPLPAGWHALQAVATAAAAALFGRIAWRWARHQRLGRQLVAMLHAGLVWLVVALALQAVAHALAAVGRPGALGLAPVHALALGWMGSTLFAMASRVAGAFGGQAQAADRVTWRLFTLVQVAALARVGAALWPPASPWLTPLAAVAWAAAGAGWLLFYGRWLGRPRPGPRGNPRGDERGDERRRQRGT
jgi:uncharacterized protein involved in response to NO